MTLTKQTAPTQDRRYTVAVVFAGKSDEAAYFLGTWDLNGAQDMQRVMDNAKAHEAKVDDPIGAEYWVVIEAVAIPGNIYFVLPDSPALLEGVDREFITERCALNASISGANHGQHVLFAKELPPDADHDSKIYNRVRIYMHLFCIEPSELLVQKVIAVFGVEFKDLEGEQTVSLLLTMLHRLIIGMPGDKSRQSAWCVMTAMQDALLERHKKTYAAQFDAEREREGQSLN